MNLIVEITERAGKLRGLAQDRFGLMMDIENVHTRCGGLQLAALLDADDENFAHDVYGIHRHFDRQTLTLTDCFVPRFAAQYAKVD